MVGFWFQIWPYFHPRYILGSHKFNIFRTKDDGSGWRVLVNWLGCEASHISATPICFEEGLWNNPTNRSPSFQGWWLNCWNGFRTRKTLTWRCRARVSSFVQRRWYDVHGLFASHGLLLCSMASRSKSCSYHGAIQSVTHRPSRHDRGHVGKLPLLSSGIPWSNMIAVQNDLAGPSSTEAIGTRQWWSFCGTRQMKHTHVALQGENPPSVLVCGSVRYSHREFQAHPQATAAWITGHHVVRAGERSQAIPRICSCKAPFAVTMLNDWVGHNMCFLLIAGS